jgi:hypothetical protein
MSDELATAATFTDLTQAQNARAALEAAGIDTNLRDENTGSIDWGLMPALGGLRLQVKNADLARALEVLNESGLGEDSPAESEPSDSADPDEVEYRESSRRRKRLVGLVSFLIIFLPFLISIMVILLID